ncbi:MAG TPA: NTP transferase domain-containing protein [Micromonosporaceae bacterium]
MTDFAAIVLAGGAARRMGGADKPARPVAGRPMLCRVLAAVVDATPRVVVGAADGLPHGVLQTRERPAGAGPVAATAAGMAMLGPATATVALLAADLPLLTADAIGALRRAAAAGEADGACYVDEGGRLQSLCGVWRVRALRRALDELAAAREAGLAAARDAGAAAGRDAGAVTDREAALAGASVKALLAGLAVTPVPWAGHGLPPWFDCDTDEDLRRVEEWTREHA